MTPTSPGSIVPKRSALDENFPAMQLAPVAERESWRKEVFRPVYHMHKWWAKRLGSVFRAILLSAFTPPEQDVWAQFYRKHDLAGKVVLDPFMGSGTTLGEALKLNASVVGCDINPVSAFLVKKSLQPVDLAALRRAYERLQTRYWPKIERFYKSKWPPTGEEADVLYTFWVMTALCSTCHERSRLFSRWIFAQDAYPARKPEAQCVCPRCGGISSVRFDAVRHACPHCCFTFDPQTGPADRQSFSCEHCGQKNSIRKAIALAAVPPSYEMYGHLLLLANGDKVYKAADAGDHARYGEAAAAFALSTAPYPQEEIPPGNNTDQLRSYGFTHWHQIFNPRQLYSQAALLAEIGREPDQTLRENLLLLFSGTLEFNNMLCSYKGEGTGAVRHLFSHHILKPERMPLENHPWGTPKSSGTFSNLFARRILAAKEYCLDPFEVRVSSAGAAEKVYGINRPINAAPAADFSEIQRGEANALILSGSSASLPLPNASVDVIVTDPPYFDMVHYSELADFFYVWLKIALTDDRTFQPITGRHSEEVQSADVDRFEDALAAVFWECARVLRPTGLMAFTFHHSKPHAWSAVVGAVCRAGMQIVAAHPVKAEMSGAVPKAQTKEPINLDAILVCRHRETAAEATGDAEATPGEDDLAQATLKARKSVRDFNQGGVLLSRGDLKVVVYSKIAATAGSSSEFGRLSGGVPGLVEVLYQEQRMEPKAQNLGERPEQLALL